MKLDGYEEQILKMQMLFDKKLKEVSEEKE